MRSAAIYDKLSPLTRRFAPHPLLASSFSCIANLANTILGSGLLGLPGAFAGAVAFSEEAQRLADAIATAAVPGPADGRSGDAGNAMNAPAAAAQGPAVEEAPG